MSAKTARERVRAELTAEILAAARSQLAEHGAASLSLRAVAREVGMVSSAVYRYFASRDDLLTALIIEGYNAVGEAVEQAEAACVPEDYLARWLAVCGAVRDWALAHPHEYALLFGSPVPGYRAPDDTIAPAIRDTLVYGGIVRDAYKAGALAEPDPALSLPASFAPDAATVRDLVMPEVPDEIVARALMAWTGLFGWVSFEVFGQFNNVISDRSAIFDHTMRSLARHLGLPS
jgi:AcrR family transcriptional regulator